MIARILALTIGLASVATTALGMSPEGLQRVIEQETERAKAQLSLDDSGPPWRISVDWVDQATAAYGADFGALMMEKLDRPEAPTRYLLTEVRQGDEGLDSSDLDMGGGLLYRQLPVELDEWNLARALWLQLDASYKSAVSDLTQKTMALNGEPPKRPAVAPQEPAVSEEETPLQLEADWVKETTLALSASLRGFEGLEDAHSVGSQVSTRVFSYTTEGTWLTRVYSELVFRIQIEARASDGTLLSADRSWIGRRADQLPSREEMLQEVQRMAELLLERTQAPLLGDYIGPVLLEEPAALELFRQLLMPEILGTPPPVSAARYWVDGNAQRPRQARIGRRLLPFGWSVVDDATQDTPGAYRWDYEGVAPTRVDVVVDGVLQEPLMSRIPQDFESRSTGHGRSKSTNRREAMPGVVYVAPPRELSRRRLERKALRAASAVGRDSVLVISRIQPPALVQQIDLYFAGDEAPAGLSRPTEAYLLHRDGRKEVVRIGSFLGVDRRALRDIVAAGQPSPVRGVLDKAPSTIRFSTSLTGGVQSGWSVPSVLVSEFELVDRSGGEVRLLAPRP